MSFQIYLNGIGWTDHRVPAVLEAVKQYDERLYFDKHPVYGDWCVFIKMPHGQDSLPIMNYGREIPHPDDVMKRLYKADALRRGEEILDNMNRHNDDLRDQDRAIVDEAEWEAAEVIESFNHRIGETSYNRSLRKQDPKHRN